MAVMTVTAETKDAAVLCVAPVTGSEMACNGFSR
jgi:hypothetical protein